MGATPFPTAKGGLSMLQAMQATLVAFCAQFEVLAALQKPALCEPEFPEVASLAEGSIHKSGKGTHQATILYHSPLQI